MLLKVSHRVLMIQSAWLAPWRTRPSLSIPSTDRLGTISRATPSFSHVQASAMTVNCCDLHLKCICDSVCQRQAPGITALVRSSSTPAHLMVLCSKLRPSVGFVGRSCRQPLFPFSAFKCMHQEFSILTPRPRFQFFAS